MTKQNKCVLAIILGAPFVIMLINKLYHVFYRVLFPCTVDRYECLSPTMPGFMTLMTVIALIMFAVYIVLDKKM